jgi:ABC-type branched-subunit amino acid transport system substrate-binding protein
MKRRSFLWVGFLAVAVTATGAWAQEKATVYKLGYMSSLSGPFAAVSETQKRGVLLAVDQVNAKGGLNMPWGKVKVELLIKDDEQKLDVGIRRFRELASDKINGLTGTIWNPMAAALNEECKITPIPYFPGCVPALDSFKKGNMAEGTFSLAFTPWSIGYLSGASVIKTLGKKKIYYLSRTDSWGSTIHEGLKQACQEYGGEIIGVAEVPAGTVDFTSVINKAKSLKPDVFVNCHFGGDAIASFKQSYELGLQKTTTMFNTWITNVVASGIPANVLNGLYGLMYHYYDLQGFADRDIAARSKTYSDDHIKKFDEPPDAYGTIAFMATELLFQAVEKAGSFDSKKISSLVMGSKEFTGLKGPVYFREDHEMVSKYLAFLVKGKAPNEKKGKWDLFKVEGHFGGESALPPLKALGY